MIQGNFQSNLPLLSAWGHYSKKKKKSAIGKKESLSKLNQKQIPGYEKETDVELSGLRRVTVYNYITSTASLPLPGRPTREQELGQKS